MNIPPGLSIKTYFFCKRQAVKITKKACGYDPISNIGLTLMSWHVILGKFALETHSCFNFISIFKSEDKIMMPDDLLYKIHNSIEAFGCLLYNFKT